MFTLIKEETPETHISVLILFLKSETMFTLIKEETPETHISVSILFLKSEKKNAF